MLNQQETNEYVYLYRTLRGYMLDTVSKHTRKDIVRNNIS